MTSYPHIGKKGLVSCPHGVVQCKALELIPPGASAIDALHRHCFTPKYWTVDRGKMRRLLVGAGHTYYTCHPEAFRPLTRQPAEPLPQVSIKPLGRARFPNGRISCASGMVL